MDLYYLEIQRIELILTKQLEGITNYWRINPHGSQLDNHQACFPVKLPAKGIELVTREGI